MNNNPKSYGTMASTSEVEFSGRGSSSPEFNALCDSIVTNIYTINQSWKTIETCFKSLGTIRDNQGLRDKIHVTQLSTNQIISVTNMNIQKLTILVRKCGKPQKLQVEKLTDNFKEAIARYSSLQNQAADKMKSNLLVVASIENESAEGNEQLQEQFQKTSELAFEQDMLMDRESRIRQIEADVIDVNQIMRDLSALVNQQGEVIDTIENSIDHATGNVEEGASELIKAANYQNKYRRKLLYLVIIAFIISAILVTVLVTQLKKK